MKSTIKIRQIISEDKENPMWSTQDQSGSLLHRHRSEDNGIWDADANWSYGSQAGHVTISQG